MTNANDHEPPAGMNWRRVIGSLVVVPVYFALFLFLPAGSWDWLNGWRLIAVLLGTVAIAIAAAIAAVELAGYRQYTQRVRYRLLPGVW